MTAEPKSRPLLFSALLASCALFVAGCLDVEEEYTINPDRSGKVAFAFKRLESGLNFSMSGKALEGEEKLQQFIVDMIEQSKGVAAWADIEAELNDDGQPSISGVAYFDDIRRFSLKYGSVSISGNDVVWTETGNGLVELSIGDRDDDETITSGTQSREALTEEQIQGEMKKQRQQAEHLLPMLRASLDGMRIAHTFRLASPPTSVSGFEPVDGTYRHQTSGREILGKLDAVADNEELIRAMAIDKLTGANQGSGDSETRERLMGKPARLVFENSGPPLFDYASEVAAAKEAFPTTMIAFGLERQLPGLLPPEQGMGFASLELGGVQLTRDLGLDFQARPFNTDPGLKLSFVGRFEGRINSFVEARLHEAIDQSGASILSESEWEQTTTMAFLNDVQDLAVFDVTLKPRPETTTVKRLSGTVVYTVASETETFSLGFNTIEAGAAGTIEGALIKSVGKARWGDGFELEVTVPYARAAVKELRIYLPSGELFDAEAGGSMYSGNETTFTMRSKTGFPSALDLRVEIYSDIKRMETPFEYTNIELPELR